MKAAIRLAARGKGYVSPNPLVGAVIVRDGVIVGKGYHKVFGGDHAEVAAIKDAGRLTKGATLYCNLEPCSHHGKTPPCVDSIIRSEIKRVVIALQDPNPLVNGKGINILKENGIDVVSGVLTEQAEVLNKFFIKFVRSHTPFVTLKMAQTLNGRINYNKNTRIQITGEEAQKYVHKMRAEYDAVLIGKNTAIVDDPLLTPRLVKGRAPKRIIVDTNLEVNESLSMFATLEKGDVFIATASNNKKRIKEFKALGIKIIKVRKNKESKIDLKYLLNKLVKLDIMSVLVEGGADIFTGFLSEKLADHVIMLYSPKIFDQGLPFVNSKYLKSNFELENLKTRKLGEDFLIEGTPMAI